MSANPSSTPANPLSSFKSSDPNKRWADEEEENEDDRGRDDDRDTNEKPSASASSKGGSLQDDDDFNDRPRSYADENDDDRPRGGNYSSSDRAYGGGDRYRGQFRDRGNRPPRSYNDDRGDRRGGGGRDRYHGDREDRGDRRYGGDRGERRSYRDDYQPRSDDRDRRRDDDGERESGPRETNYPLPEQAPFKAYVGNLHYEVLDEDLSDFFRPLPIKNIQRMRKSGGRFSGVVYVEFDSLDDLKEALKNDRREMLGRHVRVDVAHAKKEDENGEKNDGKDEDGFEPVNRSDDRRRRGFRDGGRRDDRRDDRERREYRDNRDRGGHGRGGDDRRERDREREGRDDRDRDDHYREERRDDRRDDRPREVSSPPAAASSSASASSAAPASASAAAADAGTPTGGERKRLQLKPRSVAGAPLAPADSKRNANIFGEALPRELVLEKRHTGQSPANSAQSSPAPPPPADLKSSPTLSSTAAPSTRTQGRPYANGGSSRSGGERRGPSGSDRRGGDRRYESRDQKRAQRPANQPAEEEEDNTGRANHFSALSTDDD